MGVSADPGATVDRRAPAGLKSRLFATLVDAGTILDDAEVALLPGLDYLRVAAALDDAVARISRELANSRVQPRRMRELGRVLGQLNDTRQDLNEHRRHADTEIEAELARLHDVGSVNELFDKTPAALTRCCGLDEAGLWSIEVGEMKLVKLHRGDDGRPTALIAADRSPILVHARLVQTEVMRRRSGVLVLSGSANPRIDPATRGRFGADAHAIVSIMPEGKVIGFLHGACFPGNRHMDAFDFDAVARFARGFARVLECVVLRARISWQQDYFQRMVVSGSELADRLARAEIRFSEHDNSTGEERIAPQLPPARIRSLLTRRELEVLELMAAGRTNIEIARELVVGVGTVKFHVKHILSKLHATNRAQAVSRYMRIAAAQRTAS